MNVTHANKIVQAINTIVTGYTALSRAIEDLAWESFEDHAGMTGERPVAALQVVQPALEDVADEYEATHQQAPPEPAKTEERELVSLEQVRAVLAKLSQAGHTAQVRELIQDAGANKLSVVDPSKYGRLLVRAEAIADA
ncbi:hypothetical protein [Brevibacterium paucivorans]|uniref:rRNA biogenesis protein rrp5 n=1 Tax=Brevibacterium paucivorans TaxID=170994 RepID=A0A2N6VQT0_9MICO|nr:hypothetical protein [Brevibacterium paucivorans]PMD06457.1 hypothetical protein CJ199_03580 [Brevibacterium paucivorans]